MVHEHRRHSRLRVESLIPVNLGRDNGGIILDASEGGLRIRAVGRLEAEQITLVWFAPLEKKNRIETICQIAWVDESGTAGGVRFLDLPADCHQKIHDWLARDATPGETQPQEIPIRARAAQTKVAESLPAPKKIASSNALPGATAATTEEKPPPPIPSFYATTGPTLFTFADKTFPASEAGLRGDENQETLREFQPVAHQPAIIHEFKLSKQRTPERIARERQLRRKHVRAGLAVGLLAAAIAAGVVLFRLERERVEAFFGNIEQWVTESTRPSGSSRPTIPARSPAKSPPPRASGNLRRRQPVAAGKASSPGAADVRNQPGASAKPSGAAELEVLDSSNQRRTVKVRSSVLKLRDWPYGRVALRTDVPAPTGATPAQPASAGSSTLPKSGSAQEISGGLPERQEMPAYPPLALQNNMQGTVVLRAVIGKDGTVQDVQLISGPPLLASAVLDAVRKWRYTPYYRNGEPITVEKQITVEFTISTK